MPRSVALLEIPSLAPDESYAFACGFVRNYNYMVDIYRSFLKRKPEVVITWQDTETTAQGFLVMDSMRGGAAGGGTRIHAGVDVAEVTHLAKTMGIKFAVSGPAIGGAKSGIRYTFTDEEDKRQVLRRWFSFIRHELETRYGTGGDVNVDHGKDVVPLLAELGIMHPQAGIVRGHFNYDDAEFKRAIARLQQGISAPFLVDPFLYRLHFTVADAITGYGVVESVNAFLSAHGDSLTGKRVVVEGFGNVGGAAAYFFECAGACVVAIIDKDDAIVSAAGIPVRTLVAQRGVGRGLPHTAPGVRSRIELTDELVALRADIFVPAATSKTIDRGVLDGLERMGVFLIASGANNPFVEDSFEAIDTAINADERFSVIPDYIANCGMARAFAYCMEPSADVSAAAIARDVQQRIAGAVRDAVGESRRHTGILQYSLGNILQQLG